MQVNLIRNTNQSRRGGRPIIRPLKVEFLAIAGGGGATTASSSAPSTATSTGTAGTIAYDADYIYVCVATNSWKRASLTTW